MHIRPVQDQDYAEVALLRSQTIRTVNAKDYPEDVIENWSAKMNAEDLRKSADTCKRWIAVEGEKIIGFCEHTFDGEVSRIYVHTGHLRRGVGSRLLKVAEQSIQEQGCTEIHLESTVTAKEFYVKNGYQVKEKNFHNNNKKEPIYKMSKKLR